MELLWKRLYRCIGGKFLRIFGGLLFVNVEQGNGLRRFFDQMDVKLTYRKHPSKFTKTGLSSYLRLAYAQLFHKGVLEEVGEVDVVLYGESIKPAGNRQVFPYRLGVVQTAIEECVRADERGKTAILGRECGDGGWCRNIHALLLHVPEHEAEGVGCHIKPLGNGGCLREASVDVGERDEKAAFLGLKKSGINVFHSGSSFL